MKKRLITMAIAIAMTMSLVSCGGGNETPTDVLEATINVNVAGEAGATAGNKGGVVIEVNTSYGTQTTAKTTTATSKQTATTVKATTKAATAKTTVKTTAKKTTAKKTTAKPQPKTTAKATTKATQKLLTQADIDELTRIGIEYIKTLPKAYVDKEYSAGFDLELTIYPRYTFESVKSKMLEDIKYCYEDALIAGNDRIGMYPRFIPENGKWRYATEYIL